MPKQQSEKHYYAFGSLIQSRTEAPEDYRFGYNGKEKDKETTTYDYGFRIYNPGLARFLSVDPLIASFPFYTPYQFAGNKPIFAIDLDGLEDVTYKVLERYDDGSVLVSVEIAPGTMSNSNDGNLIIHNLDNGKSYSYFEYQELNFLFGVGETESNVMDKIRISPLFQSTPGAPSDQYYFDFGQVEEDKLPVDGYPTDPNSNNKRIKSFTAIVKQKTSDEPKYLSGGSTTPLLSSAEEQQKFLLDDINGGITPQLDKFGQKASDVKSIFISLGTDSFDTVLTDDFKTTLKAKYPNADITFRRDPSDTGYSTTVIGTTVGTAPAPIEEGK